MILLGCEAKEHQNNRVTQNRKMVVQTKFN